MIYRRVNGRNKERAVKKKEQRKAFKCVLG